MARSGYNFPDFHFDTSTLMEVYTAMGIKTDKILNHYGYVTFMSKYEYKLLSL